MARKKQIGKTRSSSSGSEIFVPASPPSSLFEPSHLEVRTSAPALKEKADEKKVKRAPKRVANQRWRLQAV